MLKTAIISAAIASSSLADTQILEFDTNLWGPGEYHIVMTFDKVPAPIQMPWYEHSNCHSLGESWVEIYDEQGAMVGYFEGIDSEAYPNFNHHRHWISDYPEGVEDSCWWKIGCTLYQDDGRAPQLGDIIYVQLVAQKTDWFSGEQTIFDVQPVEQWEGVNRHVLIYFADGSFRTGSSWNLQITNILDSDINDDGKTNGLDVGMFSYLYQNGMLSADMNGDGSVNGLDVSSFLSSYMENRS
tara:strand:+ start:186229 stop:186951 length:723 start_codon:yes stop_codon:yes gene_type:complete